MKNMKFKEMKLLVDSVIENASTFNTTAILETSKMKQSYKIWRLTTQFSRETFWMTAAMTNQQDAGVYRRKQTTRGSRLLETMYGKDTLLSTTLNHQSMALCMLVMVLKTPTFVSQFDLL